jgi:hypothetical protein
MYSARNLSPEFFDVRLEAGTFPFASAQFLLWGSISKLLGAPSAWTPLGPKGHRFKIEVCDGEVL